MGQQARTRRERREALRRETKSHQHTSRGFPGLIGVLVAVVLLGAIVLVARAAFTPSTPSVGASGSGPPSQMDGMGSENGPGVSVGTAMGLVNRAVPATNDHKVSLADYRGKKLVVFFYEGATCGSCQQELIALQKDLPTIRRAGGEVVAVTVDSVAQSRSVAQQLKLGFPILSDLDHRIGSAFHDYHLTTAGMDMGPVDNHAVFILDRSGVVRWKFMAAATMWVDPQKLLHALQRV